MSRTPISFAAVKRRLQAEANPEDAEFLQRFFKTAPGQYGAGDKFLGIRVPATRRLAREFAELSLSDVERLLREPWHEARLLALVLMVHSYERGSTATRVKLFRMYLANTRYINNWDLVDASAAGIVGAHLETRSRSRLDSLSKSNDLWERRIALIATLWMIRRGEFDDTLRISERLLGDRHDLIHKAVGWMLREVGKRDGAVLERFLDTHSKRMPRTALRYAIERMTPARRRHFLGTRT